MARGRGRRELAEALKSVRELRRDTDAAIAAARENPLHANRS
jgi:hypothetical protein